MKLRTDRPLSRAIALGLLSALAATGGCGDSERETPMSESPPAHGPPGGILDVDTNSIGSAGEAGSAAGGKPAQGGSGGAAGNGSGGFGAAASGAGSGGTNGGASGVGKPCATSADCSPSLYCRQDSLDYIAHKQCTIDCEANSTCEAAFGETSFCIGARICVLACRAASDCPAQTECTASHWCMRSGPGSGVPRCTGPVSTCGLLDASRCQLTAGCIYGSDCSGIAVSCSSLSTSAACARQSGCRWNSADQLCSGVASSCSSMHVSSFCTSQEGCHWSETCTGTARACSALAPSLCSTQPGCSLSYD